MHTVRNFSTAFKTAMAAGLLVTGVTAVQAGEAKGSQIVVESNAAMQEWQADVTRTLDRSLQRAEKTTGVEPVSGIVRLRFTLDGYGRPHDMNVYSSSGDRRTDRVAMTAVRNLKQLADAPVQGAQDKTFQANIIFADHEGEYRKLAAKLDDMERTRLAQASGESSVVTFGI